MIAHEHYKETIFSGNQTEIIKIPSNEEMEKDNPFSSDVDFEEEFDFEQEFNFDTFGDDDNDDW